MHFWLMNVEEEEWDTTEKRSVLTPLRPFCIVTTQDYAMIGVTSGKHNWKALSQTIYWMSEWQDAGDGFPVSAEIGLQRLHDFIQTHDTQSSSRKCKKTVVAAQPNVIIIYRQSESVREGEHIPALVKYLQDCQYTVKPVSASLVGMLA